MAPQLIPDNFASIKIVSNGFLPAGTIMVSPDIWKSMRETYHEEGRDRAFLRAIGIVTDPPNEPPKPERVK